jgi:hypothetical protein
MRDIEIRYTWLDEQGRTREGKVDYQGPLKGKEQARVRTTIRLEKAGDLERRVRVQITAASLKD